MYSGHVLLCTNQRKSIYIYLDIGCILYVSYENESKLVLYQQVTIVSELQPFHLESLEETIPDEIRALCSRYDHFTVNENSVQNGTINKANTLVCGRLCISSKTRWGITSKGLQKYTFCPRDTSYPTYIVASKLKPTSIDVYCKVDIAKWESSETHPKGALVDILGNVNNTSIYVDVITQSYQILSRNRNTNLREESKLYNSKTTNNIDCTIDEDWTDAQYTISIDPPGCTDIDDALSVTTNNNITEYAVHIANPTLWFDTNSLTHQMAYNQTSTVYTTHKIHHLLNPILSTNKASLLENTEKYCLSVVWSTVKSPRLVRTKIINKHAYTYAQSETTESYKKILNGYYKIWKHYPKNSHDLIEQSMMHTNVFVAKFLVKNIKEKSLLRTTFENSAYYLNYTKEKSTKHDALNEDYYTHFTSPLRRFADQIVHRQCLNIITKQPCNIFAKIDNIIHLNIQKKRLKKTDSEEKWCMLANPDSIVRLEGTLLYVHDNGYARIETMYKDNALRISIPIVSQKIINIMRIETHNNVVCLRCNNNTNTLEFNINSNIILDLHWILSKGLEGFRFEWIHPPVSSWLNTFIS